MTRTEPAASPVPVRMWQIGAVAQRTELSIRTIRHYEEVGLVRPSGRSEGGFRLYTEPDIDRLFLIRRMKPLGFSLEEMADLLAAADAHRDSPDDTTAAELDRFLGLATERRESLALQLSRADDFIAELRRAQSSHGRA